jgi:hypothetical protein
MPGASQMPLGARLLVGLTLALALLGPAPRTVLAADRTPQLMDGKQTLYQRVLTRPGARLAAKPGQTGGEIQPAFSQFYVYGREQRGGREWLEVGAGRHGRVDGWLEAALTLPWRQQMALAFTNPANRDRTLMFRDRKDLMAVLQAEDPGRVAGALRAAVTSGKGDPRIVAIEPQDYIDISEQFYLLPILEAEEVVTHRGYTRVLEVASVSAREDERLPGGKPKPPARPESESVLRTFTATVVFVIDSTISMGPYIDRTRTAVRRIYDTVEQAGLLDQVKFGLIAYRSNVGAVPGLEYVSRVFVDPTEVKGGQDFLRKVSSLSPAKVSSPRFDEDAYAGIMNALETVDWSRFGGRYVVLITDAGALEGNSPLSATRLGAEQVRIEAQQLGAALYTLHLKTPQGRMNHAEAERQYRTLAHNDVVGRPLYYGVDAGDVGTFGNVVDTLAGAIVEQVRAASRGEIVPGSARTARAPAHDKPDKAQNVTDQLREDTRLLGYAMQLAYLGRVQGTQAPDVFKAWVSDRDFADPELATTEVRVLLTKNQLSDLRDVVQAILDAGDRAQHDVGTADFFDLLRSSAAHLARDPNRLHDPDASKLGELGLLGEYLEGLPYRSAVMNLSAEDWETWGIDRQEEFLDALRRKLRHYQVYHDDADRWIALTSKADPGEHVYPVPLEALP